MKKVIAMLLAVAMALTFIACAKTEKQDTQKADAATPAADASSAGETEQSGKKRVIGIGTYSMDNTAIYPLIQAMVDGVTARGDEYVLVSASGADDTARLLEIGEEFTARDDMAGIIFNNINDTLYTDVVAKCNEKGIPVVFNDIPFACDEDHKVTANVVNDNYGAGVACAQRLADDFDGKANVILFVHRGNAAVAARTEGIYDTFANYPDINVLYEGLVTLSVEEASKNMEDLLMTYDNIDAVIGICDNTPIGCVAAIKAQGREGIKLYSIDGSKDIMPYIKSGDIVMTAAQDFTRMGEESCKALYAALDEGATDYNVEILCEAPVVDSSNVDEWIDKFENAQYTFIK